MRKIKLTSFHNERYKMELTSKTRKQFVFVDTYRCYYNVNYYLHLLYGY